MDKFNFTGIGRAKVWQNKYGYWSISIAKKQKDSDKYEYGSFGVSFKKDADKGLTSGQAINITNSFVTFDKYENKEGKTVVNFYLKILDFEIIDDENKEEEPANIPEFAPTDEDDDLPF